MLQASGQLFPVMGQPPPWSAVPRRASVALLPGPKTAEKGG
jgi:hypothetical protein